MYNTQQTGFTDPMLVYSWASVAHEGSTSRRSTRILYTVPDEHDTLTQCWDWGDWVLISVAVTSCVRKNNQDPALFRFEPNISW